MVNISAMAGSSSTTGFWRSCHPIARADRRSRSAMTRRESGRVPGDMPRHPRLRRQVEYAGRRSCRPPSFVGVAVRDSSAPRGSSRAARPPPLRAQVDLQVRHRHPCRPNSWSAPTRRPPGRRCDPEYAAFENYRSRTNVGPSVAAITSSRMSAGPARTAGPWPRRIRRRRRAARAGRRRRNRRRGAYAGKPTWRRQPASESSFSRARDRVFLPAPSMPSMATMYPMASSGSARACTGPRRRRRCTPPAPWTAWSATRPAPPRGCARPSRRGSSAGGTPGCRTRRPW